MNSDDANRRIVIGDYWSLEVPTAFFKNSLSQMAPLYFGGNKEPSG
jgi:hypothetical protein